VQRYLTEIEVAHALGFKRWRDFEKAQRTGFVPAPDAQYPDGPRWSGMVLESLLSGRLEKLEAMAREDDLIERLERGESAPLPGARQKKR
jgi:hypothetical protein